MEKSSNAPPALETDNCALPETRPGFKSGVRAKLKFPLMAAARNPLVPPGGFSSTRRAADNWSAADLSVLHVGQREVQIRQRQHIAPAAGVIFDFQKLALRKVSLPRSICGAFDDCRFGFAGLAGFPCNAFSSGSRLLLPSGF